MTRRLSVLATVILLLFAVVAVQSANLQFFRSKSLAASSHNPRNEVALESAPRGEIVAADGTVLAESVPTGQGRDVYRRLYPMGALTSDVVGFTSPYYGAWGLEAEYNSDLKAHAQPPQSLEQLIAPTSAADNVVLTIYPSLQRVMAKALAGRNGAAVALDPQNGDILGLYSNPNYNPASLTTTNYKAAEAAWRAVNKEDPEGFPPLGVVATEQSFPPGSTSKVVTTSAVVVSNPAILSQVFPTLRTTKLPDTDKTLSNFGYGSCGGTIARCCRHRATPALRSSVSRSAARLFRGPPTASATTRSRRSTCPVRWPALSPRPRPLPTTFPAWRTRPSVKRTCARPPWKTR